MKFEITTDKNDKAAQAAVLKVANDHGLQLHPVAHDESKAHMEVNDSAASVVKADLDEIAGIQVQTA